MDKSLNGLSQSRSFTRFIPWSFIVFNLIYLNLLLFFIVFFVFFLVVQDTNLSATALNNDLNKLITGHINEK